jgi:hypothetical protein
VQTCRYQPLLYFEQLLVEFKNLFVSGFSQADYGTAGVSFTKRACRICASFLVS